ncbi:hypothetical protein EV193_104117 [Herbihabitans rhizosphaerae]|uniref:Peptidase MA-like domain-containing protein n=1 Tax=Herbihabitans rhizosphaerae TaxID=1872711 RepID=A0A4Q7KR74_9PSEU|nr:hypothetical protein [Herbihabitans rhizosphaerae]RZS38906.1 hypothetical protein EV193_104117 [Herbihabitans rhizosphaerae]
MRGSTRLRVTLAAVIVAMIAGGLVLLSRPPAPGPPPVAEAPPVVAGRPPPVSGPVDARDSGRAAAVTELLAKRADAILRRDEALFMSTVDPNAEPTFLATQRKLFANLDGVPLSDWSYQIQPNDAANLAGLPSRVVSSAMAEELWAPGVRLRYGLREVDETPTARGMAYLFVRRGPSWYLRSDTALESVGRRSWRGPWDYAPCKVRRAKQGLVIFHPGSEPIAERLSGELDESVRAVTALWGTGWPGRVALIVPDSVGEMRALVGPGFPSDSVVAVAIADRIDPVTRRVEGQRVVTNPSGVRGLSLAALRITLRHEITHIAARGVTVDGAPMWLQEGFADYAGHRESGLSLTVAAPDLAQQVRTGGPPKRLPSDEDFRGRGRELDLAYQQAWSVTRFVASRYGEPALVEMYRSIAGAGSISPKAADDLLRRHIGLDAAGLLTAWQDYLRTELR